LDPGWVKIKIRMGSGIQDEHRSYFRGLETIFWVKNTVLKFFADPDPGSGIFLTLDPGSGMEKFGSGIRDKHPGSATHCRTALQGLFLP
jgi:hypothetical protein